MSEEMDCVWAGVSFLKNGLPQEASFSTFILDMEP